MDLDEIDWKGLIRESYRIEGIEPEECRSIFLDWAISVKGRGRPEGADQDSIGALRRRCPGSSHDLGASRRAGGRTSDRAGAVAGAGGGVRR